MSEPAGEVILYRSDDGQALVQLRAVRGTVWLTQAHMAELYDTSVPNIVQIIRRVLADGEVDQSTTNSELRVQLEGTRQVQREVKVYNLDMVLAVGYRVTTPRAVQFRQWATTVLKEYLVKGFALQDERLKDPAAADYFDELLARIREIRASEKRFYQKVREIFKVTSADYTSTSQTAKTFFATIQNKLIPPTHLRVHSQAQSAPGDAALSSKPWHGVPATNASTGAFSRAERTRRCVGGSSSMPPPGTPLASSFSIVLTRRPRTWA